MKADGTIDKYKARLAIKGFRQQEGLYYFDTYSTRITPIKMILAIAALRNWEVHQMDVKMTFLNGDLEKVLYMNQPEGFMAPRLESKVCRLVKSLYGLRKAPKQGHQFLPYHSNENLDSYLKESRSTRADVLTLSGKLCLRKLEMDVVFDGAFGGVRDEEAVVGEAEEALVEFMVEWCEEDEDDDRSGEDGLFN
ncbi:calcineurin B-like protein 4 [Tanacetum coccineum]|uniref:Calcineurin B-like protein 4 n=1 Tax=Tanacetum coccineum TaxID=301880 RepID=A0ABQ5H0B8_9ASTR